MTVDGELFAIRNVTAIPHNERCASDDRSVESHHGIVLVRRPVPVPGSTDDARARVHVIGREACHFAAAVGCRSKAEDITRAGARAAIDAMARGGSQIWRNQPC